jgi:excisionase family DNA binding protein
MRRISRHGRVALAAPSQNMQQTKNCSPSGTLAIAEPIRWLTLAEAAKRLGVARTALYQWLQAGKVPHHRFGRLIKIHPNDLEQFVESVRAERTWQPYGRATQN